MFVIHVLPTLLRPTLIDALVSSQTVPSVAALRSFVNFDGDNAANAERYLLSTSFVSKPSTETVEFLMVSGAQYTLYTVQCTLYIAVYNVQYTLYMLHIHTIRRACVFIRAYAVRRTAYVHMC